MPTSTSPRRNRALAAVLGAGLVAATGLTAATAADARPRPSIRAEAWGTAPDGTAVQRYTLVNGDMTVRILTYGGIVQSLEVPDADGERDNVVLGFDDLEATSRTTNPAPTSAR